MAYKCCRKPHWYVRGEQRSYNHHGRHSSHSDNTRSFLPFWADLCHQYSCVYFLCVDGVCCVSESCGSTEIHKQLQISRDHGVGYGSWYWITLPGTFHHIQMWHKHPSTKRGWFVSSVSKLMSRFYCAFYNDILQLYYWRKLSVLDRL